jgi:hypothetical protein
MPRFGSVCDESVCRVPKLTSFSTMARSRCWAHLLGNLPRSGRGGGDGEEEQRREEQGELCHGPATEPRKRDSQAAPPLLYISKTGWQTKTNTQSGGGFEC